MHKTIVLNAYGPTVRVRLKGRDNANVALVSRSNVQNLTLGKNTDLKFAS